MAEQRNTQIAERVDAQTQTDTSTVEDLTLSQKLTALAHHKLESAPPPPSRTTSLDKFDKDILRWKDVHFVRDFGDWFNPEKAVQPTYTRLLSSCGYLPPLDPVESSDSSIPNQGDGGLISPDTNDTNVERDFVLESELEDTTVVEHTPGSIQTARSSTVTVYPSIKDASVGDTLDSKPTVSSGTD